MLKSSLSDSVHSIFYVPHWCQRTSFIGKFTRYSVVGTRPQFYLIVAVQSRARIGLPPVPRWLAIGR